MPTGTGEARGGASWQRHNIADHDDASGTGVNGDLKFAALSGPILTDTTNGHTYRLVSTSGSLVLTQVT